MQNDQLCNNQQKLLVSSYSSILRYYLNVCPDAVWWFDTELGIDFTGCTRVRMPIHAPLAIYY
jgi:hypothetical protein